MYYFVFKTLITALIVSSISEISRRSTLWAGIIDSLPLVTLLAMIWIQLETQDTERLISLSYRILWLIFPSIGFFIVFPFLLNQGVRFLFALPLSCCVMSVLYFCTLQIMNSWQNN
jgi:hypothetical protein